MWRGLLASLVLEVARRRTKKMKRNKEKKQHGYVLFKSVRGVL